MCSNVGAGTGAGVDATHEAPTPRRGGGSPVDLTNLLSATAKDPA
jgi:hypothetical protein